MPKQRRERLRIPFENLRNNSETDLQRKRIVIQLSRGGRRRAELRDRLSLGNGVTTLSPPIRSLSTSTCRACLLTSATAASHRECIPRGVYDY